MNELLSMSKYWEELLFRENANDAIRMELNSLYMKLGSRKMLELMMKGVRSDK